jgi:hypothetical protein
MKNLPREQNGGGDGGCGLDGAAPWGFRTVPTRRSSNSDPLDALRCD